MASSDEYDDDDAFLCDPSVEAAIQQIESSAQALALAQHTKRVIPRLEVELNDNGVTVESDTAQIALDFLAAPASQSSVVETEFVETVTALISEPSPDVREGEGQPEDKGNGMEVDEAKEQEMFAVEELDERNLFERFRKRGFFSVTDLVSPTWCEVQYDYRLRSKPYLPVAERPTSITTKAGTEIVLNKSIAAGHEKIMKKGESIHKTLELAIHPIQLTFSTSTREEVWGLRLLNMLASLASLIDGGKCREIPVVGFLRGRMLVGIVDEVTRKPITSKAGLNIRSSKLNSKRSSSTQPSSSPKTPKKPKSTAKPTTSPLTQTSLTNFFTPLAPLASSPIKPQPTASIPQTTQTTLPFLLPQPPLPPSRRPKTHRLFIADNKTRASSTMPRPENGTAGRWQCMLYKEMMDGMIRAGLRDLREEEERREGGWGKGKGKGKEVVREGEDWEMLDPPPPPPLPATNPPTAPPTPPTPLDEFTFPHLFTHLLLSPTLPFSPQFMIEAGAVIDGNALSRWSSSLPGHEAGDWETLDGLRKVWARACGELGVGDWEKGEGGTEGLLALVYRRVKPVRGRRAATKSGRKGGEEMGGEHGRRSERVKVREREKEVNGGLGVEEALEAAVRASLGGDSGREAMEVDAEEDGSESQEELRKALEMSLVGGGLIGEETLPTEVPVGSLGGVLRNPFSGEEVGQEEEEKKEVEDEDEEMEGVPESLIPKEVLEEVERRREEEAQAEKDAAATGATGTEPSGQPISIHPSEPHSASASSSSSRSTTPPPSPSSASIIGTYRFPHSPTLLSSHLSSILDFWFGKREPQGVAVQDTGRCGWCEFEEGCEWRERKAGELGGGGRRVVESEEAGMME